MASDGGCAYRFDPGLGEELAGVRSEWQRYRDDGHLTDEGVWTCPHDTDPGEERCIFHRPVDEKDAATVVDAFRETLEATAADGSGTDDRRLQFVGARFETLELSGEPLDLRAPDATLSLSLATVAGDVDLSDAVIDTSATYFGEFECAGDADFSRTAFGGDVEFEGAVFGGDATFDDAAVAGDASFADRVGLAAARFEGDAGFTQARFEGDADFEAARFEGDARFAWTNFDGDIDFDAAAFGGHATFESIEVQGDASFSGTVAGTATFEDDADFEGATFGGSVRFQSVTFEGDAEFMCATFGGDAEFAYAVFEGDAEFATPVHSGATFEGDAEFTSATFGDSAWFQSATFEGDAEFTRASFDDEVDFASASFESGANFPETGVTGGDFTGATLTDACFESADMTEATLADADLRRANLESALLNRAALFGADLRGAAIAGAVLGDARVDEETRFLGTPDERTPRSPHTVAAIRSRRCCVYDPAYPADSDHEDVDTAKGLYRALEELGGAAARPRLQARCFVRRQDLQTGQYRDAATASGVTIEERVIAGGRWLRARVARATLLYGESPWRVVGSTAAIVLLCALLYPLYGLRADGRVLTYASAANTLRTLVKSLYFSVVTFTTLGYGDVQPVGYARIVATLETVAGSALLALLVFVFGRRATR